MKIILIALVVAVLSLSVTTAWNVSQLETSRHRARAQALATWHQALCAIEAGTRASKDESPARKRQSILFFNHLLVNIGSTPCPAPTQL